MENNSIDDSLIVKNSPLEFVVIGPSDEQDIVLVRTHDAKLDLIGFALSSLKNQFRSRERSGSMSRSVLGKIVDNFNIIFADNNKFVKVNTVTQPLFDKSEKRKITYTLCVRGNIRPNDEIFISNQFAISIFDMQYSIAKWDSVRLERAIAPLIFQCYTIHLHNKARKKLAFWVFLAYIVCVVSISIAPLFFKMYYQK